MSQTLIIKVPPAYGISVDIGGETEMNNYQGIGRLTKDPEIKYISDSQTAVATFTLAIDRPKKDGEDQGADFISCVAFGKAAEAIEKWVHKGDRFGVSGRLKTGSYKHRDGYTVYTTDVVVSAMDFLEKKQKDEQRASQAPVEDVQQAPVEGTQQSIMENFQQIDDDIPF